MVAVRSGATKIVRMLFTDFRDQIISMIDHVDVRVYFIKVVSFETMI